MIVAESYLCAMFYKWLILLFFMPVLSFAQSSQSTLLYQENELWGLMNKKPITPAVYDTLIPINNQHLFIAKKHKTSGSINSTGVISEKGKVIIPFEYLQITPLLENYIVKKWNNGSIVAGVLSQSNKIILNIRFKQVQALGNYWVAQTLTKMYLYNKEGNVLKQVLADSVLISSNTNFVYTFKNGKRGLMHNSGTEIYPPKYKSIEFKNKKWKTTAFNKWQVISKSDTATFYADSLQIWNPETFIIGINNKFQLEHKNHKVGKNYISIQVITPSFAITKQGASFGVVSKNGDEILQPIYSNLYYQKGYFYAYKNNKCVLFDSLGIKRSILKYDSIGVINNGLFPIKRKGKWGFMNRSGKEVIHCIYNSKAHFKMGKAIINYYGAIGIINSEGNWIVKPIYEDITDFNFNFFIYKINKTYYLKNYNNDLIYFSNYKLVLNEENIYELQPNKKNKISSTGIIISKASNVSDSNKHWKIIKVGTKYGFEDVNGQLKITYRYDSLKPFSENLSAFKLRGKWGFINTAEEIIIQPHYNKVANFKNGLSVINKKGNVGLINSSGKFVLKPKYELIKFVNKDVWLVTEKGLSGLFNSQGNIIIQPKYDFVNFVNNKLIIVAKNGTYGAYDINGVNVLARIYTYIGYNAAYELLILKN